MDPRKGSGAVPETSWTLVLRKPALGLTGLLLTLACSGASAPSPAIEEPEPAKASVMDLGPNCRHVGWDEQVCGSPSVGGYDPSLWYGNRDLDGDCLKIRDAILRERSLSPATVDDCQVVAGLWRSEFSGTETADPGEVVVELVVAPHDASRRGGRKWEQTAKLAFANYPGDERQFAIITVAEARHRKDRPPVEWLPRSQPHACDFAFRYYSIIVEHALSLYKAEREALSKTFPEMCPNQDWGPLQD